MALFSHVNPSYHIRSSHSLVSRATNDTEMGKTKLSLLNSSSASYSYKAVQCLHSSSLGYKSRSQFIVAASPPTEDVVVATEPLTKEDLVGYLASGCKSKEKWR